MTTESMFGEPMAALWFVGVLAALVLLFVIGARLPIPLSGLRRWLVRCAILGGAVGITILANMALYRHDSHVDLTRSAAFTPSAEAQQVVRSLRHPLDLAYFYQKQDPAARSVITTLNLLARLNPMLRLETVDTDQNPARANELGVRIYNTAVVRSADRRIEVLTTDDREIALAILRATRERETVICFATGHGEYDIDNFEFHTHFEGSHSHSHNVEGMAVVQMEQHGLGRLRRAVEKLGLMPRKVTIAAGQSVPPDCAALVEANPRTRYAPPESGILRAYLERGGSLLLLIEPDYPVDETLAALATDAGVRIGEGVVVDPAGHYFTDEQMIAITQYARHPITQGLALSIYPGARPIAPAASDRVNAIVLFSTSRQSFLIPERGGVSGAAIEGERTSMPLAVAAEGRLGTSSDGRPFRVVAVGDADFASNSFFPYLSNADMALNSLVWLAHEERAPSARPEVEVLPTVVLTGSDVRWIFIACVLILPGVVALLGSVVWWQRRS
ncbi:MAG TPA: Gldg family protein [Stellaceae bacterium]|nr:Gldg family protein [Stellaceae bacterium]